MAPTLANRLEKHWREAPLPLKSWKMPTDFLGKQLEIAAGMPKLLRNYAKVLKIEAQMYRRPRGRRRGQLLDDLTALFARRILLTCGRGKGLHSQIATLVERCARVPRWKIARIEAGFRKSPLTAVEQARVIEMLVACAAQNVRFLEKRISASA